MLPPPDPHYNLTPAQRERLRKLGINPEESTRRFIKELKGGDLLNRRTSAHPDADAQHAA